MEPKRAKGQTLIIARVTENVILYVKIFETSTKKGGKLKIVSEQKTETIIIENKNKSLKINVRTID